MESRIWNNSDDSLTSPVLFQFTHLPAHSWHKMPLLKSLDISWNPIRVLTKESFYGLSRLQNLRVQHLPDLKRFKSLAVLPLNSTLFWNHIFSQMALITLFNLRGTAVIGITQPSPIEGTWSALFCNLSKYCWDNYVAKRSECFLLEEVVWLRLTCLIQSFLLFR